MGAEAHMRAQVGGVPSDVVFDQPVLTVAPPRAEATLALVTTAARMYPGEQWSAGTHAFRVFGLPERPTRRDGGTSTGPGKSPFAMSS